MSMEQLIDFEMMFKEGDENQHPVNRALECVYSLQEVINNSAGFQRSVEWFSEDPNFPEAMLVSRYNDIDLEDDATGILQAVQQLREGHNQ
jgi:hypothetical protein